MGGILARQRRQELVDLNLKLRQINAELRKRASGGVSPSVLPFAVQFFMCLQDILYSATTVIAAGKSCTA